MKYCMELQMEKLVSYRLAGTYKCIHIVIGFLDVVSSLTITSLIILLYVTIFQELMGFFCFLYHLVSDTFIDLYYFVDTNRQ